LEINLSAEAKILLNELRGRPEFFEVLDSLRIEKAPLYKPIRTLDSNKLHPVVQDNNWKYDSGAYSENMRILNFLGDTK